ncbi:MAG: DEAD/DEAH box helicase, partial [Anaerolineae bacterium]|nr:DEAD/DEAH box helicase [Anaerolineae bacterium]
MTTQFSDLNLHPDLMQALEKAGYTEPTPIQAQMIPIMLTGVDVIGQAQTGTGKTAAFALPIIQNLIPGQRKPQALILSPRRELAMQVAKAFETYGAYSDVRVLAIYGGSSYGRQISALKRGVDVVVGTPGRLLDLLKRKSLDLSAVTTLVLDEGDEMLSMGFIDDIETLLDATSLRRQIALFSATMPTAIRRLASKYLNEPQSIVIKDKQLTVAAIEQRYYVVNQRDKLAAITRIFETEEVSRALIFARTRAGTGELANALASRGFSADMINGDLSQDARERVMSRFKNDQVKVLVATDVAARGLDIDDISHVFNYDLPDDPEVFVHRIGRTGRAGKEGIAISLFTPKETRMLRRIEGYTRQKQT